MIVPLTPPPHHPTQRSEGAELGVMAQVLDKLKQQVSNRRDLKVRCNLHWIAVVFVV